MLCGVCTEKRVYCEKFTTETRRARRKRERGIRFGGAADGGRV
jgi:hypothetical protein